MPAPFSRHFFAALMMLCAIAAAARAAEPIAMLHVYWNAPSRPDPRIVQKGLGSAFADALKKHLNVADPAAHAELMIRFEGSDVQVVVVKKGAAQPTADEIVAMIKEHFLDTASNFFTDLASRDLQKALEQEHQEADMARRKLEEAHQRLLQIRQQLRKLTRRVDVSPDSLRAAITRLEDERDRFTLDVEGQTVRRQVIQEAIANIAKTAQAQMNDDRIAAELAKVVAARESDLRRIQQLKSQNLVAETELQNAGVGIAEAKVKLWERQEMVNRSAGGELLTDLNKELAMLSINVSESESRLKRLNQMVAEYAGAVELVDELENAQAARQQAEAARIDAEARLAERTRTLRQYQPPVVVLHAQPQ
jgi:hypothetical protein